MVGTYAPRTSALSFAITSGRYARRAKAQRSRTRFVVQSGGSADAWCAVASSQWLTRAPLAARVTRDTRIKSYVSSAIPPGQQQNYNKIVNNFKKLQNFQPCNAAGKCKGDCGCHLRIANGMGGDCSHFRCMGNCNNHREAVGGAIQKARRGLLANALTVTRRRRCASGWARRMRARA